MTFLRSILMAGLAAVLLTPFGAERSGAELVAFLFEGEVVTVGSELSGGPFAVGQPITGRYVFESTTADSNAAGKPKIPVQSLG